MAIETPKEWFLTNPFQWECHKNQEVEHSYLHNSLTHSSPMEIFIQSPLEEISTQNGPPKKNNKIIVKIIK